jgi:predicted lipoprotein
VLPTHAAFVDASDGLYRNAEAFSLNPSDETLEALRASWKTVTENWKRCEVYDFGNVSNFFLHTRIHRWPVEIDGLEENIRTEEIINEDFINSRGSSIIGLAALEYLLFKDDLATTLQGLTSDDARTAYLVAASKYLKAVAGELNLRWTEEGPAFTQRTTLSIDGGQNQLVNGLINQLEKTIRFRLRTPTGEQNGESPDPHLVETPYADFSISCIKAGFEEWKIAYRGGSPATSMIYGFDQYLTELGNTTINPNVEAAISVIDNHLVELEQSQSASSLGDLINDDVNEARQLTEEFQALLVLVRVDLSSAISVVLTITDVDGD